MVKWKTLFNRKNVKGQQELNNSSGGDLSPTAAAQLAVNDYVGNNLNPKTKLKSPEDRLANNV